MSKVSRIAKISAVSAAVIALALAGTTAANADPVPSGPRAITAVGSDTIQDLYNGFANGYNVGSVAEPATDSSIASYDAVVPGTGALGSLITTHTGDAAFGRPNGSGDGRKALSAAWNTNHVFTQSVAGDSTPNSYTLTNNDVTIARSSGKPGTIVASGAANDQLVSVPLARDAVTTASKGLSITNWTTAELTALYGGGTGASATGNFHQNASATVFTVGDIVRGSGTTDQPSYVTAVNTSGAITSQVTIHPLLPQAASGTRQFFTTAVSDPTNATASWVTDGNEENHGSALTATGDIIPFSAAQWIAQKNGVVADTGLTGITLNSINGSAPTTGTGSALAPNALLFGAVGTPPVSGAGHFNRDVYTVVPTANFTGSLKTLVTATLPSALDLAGKNVVADFGFEHISYSATAADQLHSPFEN